MTVVRSVVLGLVLLALQGLLLYGAPQQQKQEEPAEVSYYRHIRPIFQQHCQGCHQPAKPEGGLVMTSHDALLKAGSSDLPGVVPGQPEKSLIVEMITPQDGVRPKMPQGKDPLSESDVSLVKKWISQGARDDTPASARQVLVDAEHPPAYVLPPVITALDYSPDGAYLAVAGYHEVLLHQADGAGLVARLIGMSERVQSLAFSPDGTRLAVTGGAPGRFGEVQIWDIVRKKVPHPLFGELPIGELETTQLKLSVPVTYDTVYGASWSPDGTKIAFGCGDNTVRAIDARTGKQLLYQGAHSDWVMDTVFSTDGSHLVSVSRDRSMKLTEVATQRFVDNVTSITPGALKGGLLTVARHPYRDELLIGGADGVPKIYQMYRSKARKIGDDFNLIRAFPSLSGRIFAAEFNANGSRIVVGSSLDGRGEIRVYATADAKPVATFEGELGAVYALSYRRDGQAVASAGFDGVVRLHDPETGKLVREFVPVPLNPSAGR
jgi:WD40 repeat protein/mono/diheme cytochrome c family protein